MGSRKFIENCKLEVKKYAKEHLDKSDVIPDFEVFVVWYSKTLQNHKALLSTTLLDGMYYELTYNGDKKEVYFDGDGEFYQESITKQSFIDNIKSIVTHEQMEQMAYKVGE